MGHFKQVQQGVRSTTTKSNRGRPPKIKQEREAARQDAISLPKQEPGNERTNVVYMTTLKAEGFVASDQTGMLPRTSNRGMKYLCIFYLHDPNFIKGVPIKSRKRKSLSECTKKCTNNASSEDSNQSYTNLTTKCQERSKILLQHKTANCSTRLSICIGRTQQK